MSLLLDLIYFIAAIFAIPLLVRKSRRTGKYRSGWAGRLGWGPDVLPKRDPRHRVLLLHCVSVGELNSVQTLIERLLAADPHLHIALTTTTDTGTQRAQKLYGESPAKNPRVHPVRFPLDFSFAVEKLFDRVQPEAIALVELETWPNFLSIAQSRRIPVAIINGRLSERSFPRYRLIRPLMKDMLRKLTWIAMQTPAIAERFRALGAPADRLEIVPTLKYDNAQIAAGVPGQELLAQAMGLLPEHQLFAAGSTGPGEEEPLLDTYLALRDKNPNLRLAIAPRHPEVVPQVIAAIRSRTLMPVLRTERPDALQNRNLNFKNNEVFVLNTMGELRKLYALAVAAFIGRSLVKLGGSDMIEAAALGKPCCFGPYTANFAEVVELLTRENAAVIVKSQEELAAALGNWLADPASAQNMGERAQNLIENQKGSTDRYVEHLLRLVRHTAPR